MEGSNDHTHKSWMIEPEQEAFMRRGLFISRSINRAIDTQYFVTNVMNVTEYPVTLPAGLFLARSYLLPEAYKVLLATDVQSEVSTTKHTPDLLEEWTSKEELTKALVIPWE